MHPGLTLRGTFGGAVVGVLGGVFAFGLDMHHASNTLVRIQFRQ
jgi:hypothetical protein